MATLKPFKLSDLSGSNRMTREDLSKDDLLLVSDASNPKNNTKYASKSIEYGELCAAMVQDLEINISSDISSMVSGDVANQIKNKCVVLSNFNTDHLSIGVETWILTCGGI